MHGLYWLTANLAERGPLLLAVDDAQWADEPSLRFAVYLARRVRELPVALLLATRPPLESQPLRRLADLDHMSWLRPDPLDEDDVRRLIADECEATPDGRFVAACHQGSGGNPFLVAELLAAARAQTPGGAPLDADDVARLAPQGVVRWVSAHIEALGEDARALASALAVLGAAAPLADAAMLAGLDRPRAAAAADVLVAAQIVQPGYRFAQPVVAASLEDDLGPAARAEAHSRAARLAARREASAAEVAGHLLACPPEHDPWVVDDTVPRRPRGAGRRSTRVGGQLPRASARGTPSALGAARTAAAAGGSAAPGGPRGRDERLREALDATREPRRRAAIRLTLGRALFLTGDHTGAREVVRAGLVERPEADDDIARELEAWHVTLAPGAARPRTAASEWSQRLLADEAPGRTRADRRALAHLAYEAARSGAAPHDAVARLAQRALAGGARSSDGLTDIAPYSAACIALAVAGQPHALIDELDRAIEHSQRAGSAAAFRWLSLIRGTAHLLRGDLLDAVADLYSARETLSEGYDHELPGTMALLALCLLERGDIAGAEHALRLPGDQTRWKAQFSIPRYLYALGRLQAATGSLREGLATLLECGAAASAMNFTNPAANFGWRSEAALLAARLDDPERGAELVAEELRLARAFGAPRPIGVALRAAGLIDPDGVGLDLLAEAVTVLDGSSAELEHARALIDLGGALRRAGRRHDAREPLRRGLDAASRCGAARPRRARA